MTTLQEKAAEAKARMERENPSNSPGKTTAERVRVPMSLPQPKLAVPEIPGYHLHWFRGDQARIQQALQAGYEFVGPSEVDLNSVQLGGDASKDGNTDMGGRVSIVEGSLLDGQGQAVRLYLMKQKMEYFLEDRKILHAKNDGIAEALTSGYRRGTVGGVAEGERPEDVAARYVDRSRAKVPDLFRKKSR